MIDLMFIRVDTLLGLPVANSNWGSFFKVVV